MKLCWRNTKQFLNFQTVQPKNLISGCVDLLSKLEEKTAKVTHHASTLYLLAYGINHHLRDDLGRVDVEILSKKDVRFGNFRAALDAGMKQLTVEGVGTVKKHADPLTEDDEAKIMGHRCNWIAFL